MKAIIRKWGNSASVRIPASVMQAARVDLDQPVDVRADRGRIIVEPIRSQEHDLAQLVAAITDDNRHDEIDFGAPAGKEIQ